MHDYELHTKALGTYGQFKSVPHDSTLLRVRWSGSCGGAGHAGAGHVVERVMQEWVMQERVMQERVMKEQVMVS